MAAVRSSTIVRYYGIKKKKNFNRKIRDYRWLQNKLITEYGSAYIILFFDSSLFGYSGCYMKYT